MLDSLGRDERLRLMQFVCSFAWADLEIRPEERSFVARLVRRLGLDEDDRRQVQEWLETPPRPEDIDPLTIPTEHRRLFLSFAEGVVAADAEISSEERETLKVFKQLLSGS